MTEELGNDDWLFPNKSRQQAEQKERGLTFAQQYLVFSDAGGDPRAKAILAAWTQTVRRKNIAPNATAQEYAAHNAVREFVEGIHAQVEFAMNGANAPQPRTTTDDR